MTKQQYLERLQKRLSDLPREEIDTHLAFYQEMIEDRLDEGMSEEEATADMDLPEEAAEKILQELPLPRLVRQRMEGGKSWGWKEGLIIVLLAPFWLPLLSGIIGLIAGIFGLIIGLFGAVLGLTLGAGAGATVFLYSAFMNITTPGRFILAIGSAVFTVGILLLLIALFTKLIEYVGIFSKRMIDWLKRLFIRRRQYNE